MCHRSHRTNQSGFRLRLRALADRLPLRWLTGEWSIEVQPRNPTAPATRSAHAAESPVGRRPRPMQCIARCSASRLSYVPYVAPLPASNPPGRRLCVVPYQAARAVSRLPCVSGAAVRLPLSMAQHASRDASPTTRGSGTVRRLSNLLCTTSIFVSLQALGFSGRVT
jgi:hypothetical protein